MSVIHSGTSLGLKISIDKVCTGNLSIDGRGKYRVPCHFSGISILLILLELA